MASSLLLRNLTSKIKPLTSLPTLTPKIFTRWSTTTSNDEEEEEKVGPWKSSKDGKPQPMTMEELEKLPEDTIIHVPKEIPVRFTVRYNKYNKSQEKQYAATFEQLKGYYSDPVLANAVDWYCRNAIRLHFWNHIQRFRDLYSFLGKNIVFLQLILVDEDRDIQGKLYQGSYAKRPKDPDALALISKSVFKALVPFLLQDTERWVYSRSLVIKEYNRALLDETLLKFFSHDPVGSLKDIPFDMPLGTPDSEVREQQDDLVDKAVEAYKATHMPLGIHCTEVFLFVAGEFGLNDDGCLSSREAVQEFLSHLITENNIQKIYGFNELASGCPTVSPETIAILKLTE